MHQGSPQAVDVPGCDTHGLPVSHCHFIRGAGMVHTAAARSTSAQRTSALACVDRSSQPCFGQASIGSPRTAAVPVRWDSRRRASISSLNVRHAPSRLYPQPPSLGAGVGPQGSPACPEPAGKRNATLNLAEAKVSTSARLRDPDDLPGVHRKVLHGVVEAPKRVTVKPWISTRVSSVAKSSRASTASASATARDRSASRSAFVGVSSGANSRWRWREAGVPPRPLPEAWYCQVEPDGRF